MGSHINYFDRVGFDADEIIEGLYVGSEDSANEIDDLRKRRITHILIVADNCHPQFKEKIKYLKVSAEDHNDQNLLSSFEIGTKFIDSVLHKPEVGLQRKASFTFSFFNNNRKNSFLTFKKPAKEAVLVHCAAGVSRSVSFVVAYLMKYQNIPYEQALQLVKSKRRWAAPNGGFQEQLKLYERMGCEVDTSVPEVAALLKKYKKPPVESWTFGIRNVIEY